MIQTGHPGTYRFLLAAAAALSDVGLELEVEFMITFSWRWNVKGAAQNDKQKRSCRPAGSNLHS